jgi:oxygen-independent coproporphyrinogen-3 oxidase
LSLDLMYGVPEQTLSSWRHSLDRALDLEPEHMSLYPLSVEPGTAFSRMRSRGNLDVPSDRLVAEMYALAVERMREAGFTHYEVANWSVPGRGSRHNQAYWHNDEFYAIGVGAHAYLHPYRTENMRGVKRYIERMQIGKSPVATAELIDNRTRAVETVMLRLRRLDEGLDLGEMRDSLGIDLIQSACAAIAQLVDRGYLLHENGRLRLSEHAVPVANEIWERVALALCSANDPQVDKDWGKL